MKPTDARTADNGIPWLTGQRDLYGSTTTHFPDLNDVGICLSVKGRAALRMCFSRVIGPAVTPHCAGQKPRESSRFSAFGKGFPELHPIVQTHAAGFTIWT